MADSKPPIAAPAATESGLGQAVRGSDKLQRRSRHLPAADQVLAVQLGHSSLRDVRRG